MRGRDAVAIHHPRRDGPHARVPEHDAWHACEAHVPSSRHRCKEVCVPLPQCAPLTGRVPPFPTDAGDRSCHARLCASVGEPGAQAGVPPWSGKTSETWGEGGNCPWGSTVRGRRGRRLPGPARSAPVDPAVGEPARPAACRSVSCRPARRLAARRIRCTMSSRSGVC